jgi:quercetin dioxygenase-like cupin family protein
MSSLDRTIGGDVLAHHLKSEERTIDAALLERNGRTARTLVKNGPLRLTLVAVKKGGEIPTHVAPGPITIHQLEGETEFAVRDTRYLLRPGDILTLAPGVEHSGRSATGGVFLLTVVHDQPGTAAS